MSPKPDPELFSYGLMLLTLFDILPPNELDFIVALPKKMGLCIQKMSLCAVRARTNWFLATENNVKTHFTVLRPKRKKTKNKHIIELQKSFYCPLDKKVHIQSLSTDLPEPVYFRRCESVFTQHPKI